ncbi:hypothetical protein ATKI12_3896 [Kitasatospora sp. Ki12]
MPKPVGLPLHRAERPPGPEEKDTQRARRTRCRQGCWLFSRRTRPGPRG